VQIGALTGASMPDGTRCDGRYNLEGDFLNAEDNSEESS
jgi:hypothetical protein